MHYMGGLEPYQHAQHRDESDNLTYPPTTEEKASKHLEIPSYVQAVMCVTDFFARSDSCIEFSTG
jgi:hypothetical protein